MGVFSSILNIIIAKQFLERQGQWLGAKRYLKLVSRTNCYKFPKPLCLCKYFLFLKTPKGYVKDEQMRWGTRELLGTCRNEAALEIVMLVPSSSYVVGISSYAILCAACDLLPRFNILTRIVMRAMRASNQTPGWLNMWAHTRWSNQNVRQTNQTMWCRGQNEN